MGNTELKTEQAAMIAEVYGRAVAAAISCNDPGILPEAEGKKAVVGFIRVMKALDDARWYGYSEETI